MSGRRLFVGLIGMGIVLPLAIFFLLDLHTPSQLLTIAASSFLAWGAADLLASILEKPRLQNRTPGGAIREDWERRSGEPRL